MWWYIHRVLFGERPYWWVHETQFYGPVKRPELQQFSITCETGPGILQYLLQGYLKNFIFIGQSRIIQWFKLKYLFHAYLVIYLFC